MTRASTPLVLLGSAVVLVLGLFLGFKLVTASADTEAAAPTCTDRTVKPGQRLTNNLVKVDVYNASQRSGLANRVSINLQRRGFLAGGVGNVASGGNRSVTIITSDRKDPRVRLVAQQFSKVVYQDGKSLGDGVTVVIGDAYKALRKGAPRAVRSPVELTVCVPTVATTE